jgi:hypothetical protein
VVGRRTAFTQIKDNDYNSYLSNTPLPYAYRSQHMAEACVTDSSDTPYPVIDILNLDECRAPAYHIWIWSCSVCQEDYMQAIQPHTILLHLPAPLVGTAHSSTPI